VLQNITLDKKNSKHRLDKIVLFFLLHSFILQTVKGIVKITVKDIGRELNVLHTICASFLEQSYSYYKSQAYNISRCCNIEMSSDYDCNSIMKYV